MPVKGARCAKNSDTCNSDVKLFWMGWSPKTMAEVYSRLKSKEDCVSVLTPAMRANSEECIGRFAETLVAYSGAS